MIDETTDTLTSYDWYEWVRARTVVSTDRTTGSVARRVIIDGNRAYLWESTQGVLANAEITVIFTDSGGAGGSSLFSVEPQVQIMASTETGGLTRAGVPATPGTDHVLTPWSGTMSLKWIPGASSWGVTITNDGTARSFSVQASGVHNV